MNDCVFCAIVAGTGPATIVREWSDAIAFVPLGPVVPDGGHVLVVPRRHVADAVEDPAVTAATMARAAELAAGHGASNIITSVGAAATQSVFHLHVHVIRRAVGDLLMVPWGTTGNPHSPHSCARSMKAETDNARLRALVADDLSRLGQEIEADAAPQVPDSRPVGVSVHDPGCVGTHLASISCADITRLRAESEERNVLWSCPNSPSRSQTVHAFGHAKDEWTECLNGCGMTWARLQESVTWPSR